MLIVSVDQFIKIKGKYYCKPYALMSLSQYWGVFDNVKLLGVEIKGEMIPNGWLKIPDKINFHSINNINCQNPFKRRKAKKNIWDFIQDVNIVYVRMPDFRVLEIYKLIKNKIPFFCEFHGDWEEAVLAQKLNTIGFKNKIKFLLADYRAYKVNKYYKEIGKNALVNISIGPRLIDKYNLNVKPSLATANHIIKKEAIVERNIFKLKEGVLNLLFVGELQHRKGLHYLIQALSKLQKETELKFILNIVGVGYLENELQLFVKENNLLSKVKFKGAIYDRVILSKEYRNADVFILPSIAGEGVPRVIQEAQALGCSIIATDIGSTYWQLQNDSGVLIEPNNTEELINAIKLMYDDKSRAELSNNAIQNAFNFTYEKQKKDISNFLHKHLAMYINE